MLLVWTFALVAALVTVSPGPDTMLVVDAAMRQGRKAALLNVSGVVCGLLVWGAFITAEAAVATTLPTTAMILRFASGIYLAAIAIWAIRDKIWVMPIGVRGKNGATATFFYGFVSNLLNPKVGLFYLGLVPLFRGTTDSATTDYMLLAGIHTVESFLWLCLLAALGHQYQRLMTTRSGSRGIRIAQFAAEVAAAYVGTFGAAGGGSTDATPAHQQGAPEMSDVLTSRQARRPASGEPSSTSDEGGAGTLRQERRHGRPLTPG